jgi:hypothetical protein
MTDIREVMQHGNNRLEKVLESLALQSKGIYKATTTYLDDLMKVLDKTEMSTEEQVRTASITTLSIITAGFDVYRKRDIAPADDDEVKEYDLDGEKAPGDIPDKITIQCTGEAIKTIEKELDLDIKMSAIIKGALQASSAKNFVNYILILIISYFVNEGDLGVLEDADMRTERTEIPVPEDPKEGEGFSSKFQDFESMDFNKAWFRQLRK